MNDIKDWALAAVHERDVLRVQQQAQRIAELEKQVAEAEKADEPESKPKRKK